MGRGSRQQPAAAADESLRSSLRRRSGDGPPGWLDAPVAEVREPGFSPVRVDDAAAGDFAPGTRVELHRLAVTPGGFDDTALLPPGTRGTVDESFDPGKLTAFAFGRQIPVNWDNGSTLQACGDDMLVRLARVYGASDRDPGPSLVSETAHRDALELLARLRAFQAGLPDGPDDQRAAAALDVTVAALADARAAERGLSAWREHRVTSHPGPFDLTLTGRGGQRTLRAVRAEARADGTLGIVLDHGITQSVAIAEAGEIAELRDVPAPPTG